MNEISASRDPRALRVGAVLLAAGEGSRMGGVPKCLLSLSGQSLLGRQSAAMSDAGVADVVVVTGYYHERIEPVASTLPVRIVRNPHPEAGQQSSVRLGIEALGAGYDVVLVALADQPLVGSAELNELISAFAQRPAGTQVLYPEVNGQRGNPVLFSGELVAAMLAPGMKLALRKYIDEHPDKVHIYRSSNERFILDLDTREDLAAFERRTGLALALPEVR